MITILCFKWKYLGGVLLPKFKYKVITEYTATHVNKLYHMVSVNLTISHKFICITDDPIGIECETYPMWDYYRVLGGCYSRLFIFSKQFKNVFGERIVCIDLDCVITGKLNSLFNRNEDFIINQYKNDKITDQNYNGGLFLMKTGSRKKVWNKFSENSLIVLEERRKRKEIIGTDQAWISHILGKGESTYTHKDGVYDYINLENGELPKNARIVLFSGKRDPSVTVKHQPTWIKKYWI